MDNGEKTKAIIKYLFDCPAIADSSLFFNFAEAEDNNKQFITTANDKAVNKPLLMAVC